MNQTYKQKPWYAEDSGLWGETYLDEYQDTLTPERTLADVDFLERELHLEKGMKILDLCCGHGRHTIELAKRGYQMTGLDLNSFFLDKAKRDAEATDVTIDWVKSDMREVPFENEFDVVVNLFTAFGYLESDEEDQKVLQQVAKALKPGGQFTLDVINRDRIMRVFNPHDGKALADGSLAVTEREFDFTTSRNNERRVRMWPDGRKNDVKLSLRMYSLHELIKMCHAASLEYTASFGGSDSSVFDFNSMRLVLLTQKKA